MSLIELSWTAKKLRRQESFLGPQVWTVHTVLTLSGIVHFSTSLFLAKYTLFSIAIDFIMIVQCWGQLLFAQLVPKISYLLLGGPNYLRSTCLSYILDDLLRDFPLKQIWRKQPNSQIGKNMAK